MALRAVFVHLPHDGLELLARQRALGIGAQVVEGVHVERQEVAADRRVLVGVVAPARAVAGHAVAGVERVGSLARDPMVVERHRPIVKSMVAERVAVAGVADVYGEKDRGWLVWSDGVPRSEERRVGMRVTE